MKKLLMVCVAGAMAMALAQGNVIYVTPEGTGTGSSWDDAASISAAVAAAQDGDELWLKEGNYALSDTLTSAMAISVIGGFAGTEATAQERAGTSRSVLIGSDTAGTSCFESTCSWGTGYTVRFDSIAFRHGNYRGLYKSGFSDTEIVNCEFSGNGWGPTGRSSVFLRGRGAYIISTDRAAKATITDCEFIDNVICTENSYGGSDGGAGLCVEKHSSAVVTGCSFIGNGVAKNTLTQSPGRDQRSFGGGYLACGASTAVTNCVFIGNRMTGNSGGFGDGGSAVTIISDGDNSVSGSVLAHCLIVANETVQYSSSSSGIGSAVMISQANTSSANTVTIDHCTIAYNLAPHCKCGGVAARYGRVNITNSILWGNTCESSIRVGNDLMCSNNGNAIVNLSYSLVGDMGKEGTAVINDLGGVITGDPMFVTSKAAMDAHVSTATDLHYDLTAVELAALVDCHLQSPKGHYTAEGWVEDANLSPALDMADPNDDYSLEPTPNGGRANLGCYGATAQASKNIIVRPEIASAVISQRADDFTRPYLTLTTKSNEDNYGATVTLCFGSAKSEAEGTEGWQYVQTFEEKIGAAATLSELAAKAYMPLGKMYYRVIITVGSYSDVVDGEFEIGGSLPAAWGHGGGEGVIHVWAGAQGTCGGTSWLDAVKTYAEAAALVDATHTNIWIAGEVDSAAKEATVNHCVTVLGGFTGIEDAADERAAGARSIINGQKMNNGIIIDPVAAYTLNTSHISDLVFTNMFTHAIVLKTRASAEIANCDIVNCSYDDSETHGTAISVVASATDTEVLITNCTIRATYKGIGKTSDGYNAWSQVLYFNSAKSVRMVDCDIVNCGVARTYDWNMTRGREAVQGFVLEAAAPCALEGCKFRGNVFTTHKNRQVMIKLNRGGTFRNCAFVGNVGQTYAMNGLSAVTDVSMFHLTGAAYTFDNCTFAYNLVENSLAPVFIVDGCGITVNNSIVWQNLGFTGEFANQPMLASVVYLKGSNPTATFNYCDLGCTNDYPVATFAGGVESTAFVSNNGMEFDPLFATAQADVDEHIRYFFNFGGVNKTNQARYYFMGDTDCANASAFAASLNVHLRSRAGYTDETTGELVTTFRENSLAIDAGDPAADCSREPTQKRNRLNLGCYGNTPYASLRFTPPGLSVIIR